MKRLITFLIAAVLILSLTIPAFAAGGSPKIVDNADLLTAYEEAELGAMAQDLADEYNIDVVILTVYSLNGKGITAYADDYFDFNGYGIGSEHSGVILVLSMEYRDWAISTCGHGIEALSDYDQELLMDAVLDYLGDDDFYYGFKTYLNELDYYFEDWKNGNFSIVNILISIAIGIVAAIITVSVMKSGMKTAKPQHSAQSYVKTGSYHLSGQRDIFLYSNTTRVRKQSSSSGSSTHRSSSGRSHGGSRGKF